MKYNPEIHHRRSIRLAGYDYSTRGAYFVTICVHDKSWLFGQIEQGVMHLSIYGTVVDTYLHHFSQRNDQVACPAWVVMPNHMHCILMIVEDLVNSEGQSAGSLGTIVGNLKSITSRKINRMRNSQNDKVWQRNYYEHIIRDQNEYNRIKNYIETNPERWEKDAYYDM